MARDVEEESPELELGRAYAHLDHGVTPYERMGLPFRSDLAGSPSNRAGWRGGPTIRSPSHEVDHDLHRPQRFSYPAGLDLSILVLPASPNLDCISVGAPAVAK